MSLNHQSKITNQHIRIAFIEANSTGTTYAAMQTETSHSITRIFFTSDRQFYNNLTLNPLELADEIVDVHTYDPVALARAIQIHKCSHVICFDDFHLPAATLAAEMLELKGPSASGIFMTRFKDNTRTLTRSCIGSVKYHLIDCNSTNSFEIPEGFKFPIVTKPVDESGSVGVILCSNKQDVERAIELQRHSLPNIRGYQPEKKILLEEFVPGNEFSCEAIYDIKNSCWNVIGFTKKVLTPPPHFVEIGHVFPANITLHQQEYFSSIVLSWLHACKLKCGAAHVEFRVGENGIPRLIEINPRLPGGNITQLVSLTTGIDLLTKFLNFHVDDDFFTANHITTLHVFASTVFFTKSDFQSPEQFSRFLKKIHILPWIEDYSFTEWPEKNSEISSNYHRIGFVIVTANSYKYLEKRISSLRNTL